MPAMGTDRRSDGKVLLQSGQADTNVTLELLEYQAQNMQARQWRADRKRKRASSMSGA